MMTPASKTPHMAAIALDLKSIFKKLAANVPVHAPVPGSGIPTNKSSATLVASPNWPVPTYCDLLFSV